MADVAGAVVRRLLSHPSAAAFSADLTWRRLLARWARVRSRLGVPPIMLGDVVEHQASVLLVEAARAAQRAAVAN